MQYLLQHRYLEYLFLKTEYKKFILSFCFLNKKLQYLKITLLTSTDPSSKSLTPEPFNHSVYSVEPTPNMSKSVGKIVPSRSLTFPTSSLLSSFSIMHLIPLFAMNFTPCKINKNFQIK